MSLVARLSPGLSPFYSPPTNTSSVISQASMTEDSRPRCFFAAYFDGGKGRKKRSVTYDTPVVPSSIYSYVRRVWGGGEEDPLAKKQTITHRIVCAQYDCICSPPRQSSPCRLHTSDQQTADKQYSGTNQYGFAPPALASSRLGRNCNARVTVGVLCEGWGWGGVGCV